MGERIAARRRPCPSGSLATGDGDGELLTALRVVDWNIERGYEIEKIVEHLQGLAADVIVLQELDIHCVRTRCLNIPLLLARALNMQCAFVCEFIELDSDVRDPINASGPNALHGNAILSKYPLEDLRAFPHSFDRNWAECGLRLREPRIGRRVVLHASVSSTAHTLHLYCLHTEIFCGMTNRARQIADAVYDARKQYEGFLMLQPHQRTRSFHVVITGDMNTIAHGVMRLSPNYANDRMRFLLCGETEAQWLYANVLSADGVSRNPIYGFTAEDRIRMDNRELMLCDPFDLYEDITLRHRWYGSLVQGKLDWFLTSNVEILSTAIGNHDCSASDHKFHCRRYHTEQRHDPSRHVQALETTRLATTRQQGCMPWGRMRCVCGPDSGGLPQARTTFGEKIWRERYAVLWAFASGALTQVPNRVDRKKKITKIRGSQTKSAWGYSQ